MGNFHENIHVLMLSCFKMKAQNMHVKNMKAQKHARFHVVPPLPPPHYIIKVNGLLNHRATPFLTFHRSKTAIECLRPWTLRLRSTRSCSNAGSTTRRKGRILPPCSPCYSKLGRGSQTKPLVYLTFSSSGDTCYQKPLLLSLLFFFNGNFVFTVLQFFWNKCLFFY